ncbi:MAG: type II toxin-antitoxin system RelE/ParE family toxin [Actinobacteria bacterium]|nr:type II toxin-antitoxin system RelE/ParE family toxin [Actinomycetota bacterium]
MNEFIDQLAPKVQASLDLQIDRLNMLSPKDPPLPFPHSSQVRGELRELHCHYGNTLYRVFYQRSDRLFVLLHIIRKSSQKLPEADIVIAQKRMDEFRQRMNEKPRRPPRAAGRDAP